MSGCVNGDKRAVVLLSGGLDSATVLMLARSRGFFCYALSFDYGQRHRCELEAAAAVAADIGVVEHRIFNIDLRQFGGSALTDEAIAVPEHGGDGIPITYVAARNTVLLSIALSWAEVLDIRDIFIGVNAVDYSGYPDCRPEFIHAFEQTANLATKAGVEGDRFTIHAPLMGMRKEEIIKIGTTMGIDYSRTISCYNPDALGLACGHCDSCHLRSSGFALAQIADPTRYRNSDRL